MLQVVEHALRDPSDRTRFSLVFGNVSEADILLKERIDALAAAHPARLRVTYIVDKAAAAGGKAWAGRVGCAHSLLASSVVCSCLSLLRGRRSGRDDTQGLPRGGSGAGSSYRPPSSSSCSSSRQRPNRTDKKPNPASSQQQQRR